MGRVSGVCSFFDLSFFLLFFGAFTIFEGGFFGARGRGPDARCFENVDVPWDVDWRGAGGYTWCAMYQGKWGNFPFGLLFGNVSGGNDGASECRGRWVCTLNF